MIIDNLIRADKYFFLNKYFQKAFDFIKTNDLKLFDFGKFEVEGENVFVIIANDSPNPDFVKIIEAHKKYIDIQIVLDGSFHITWKALENCNQIISDYSNEKDAIFFADEEDFEILIKPGTFAILMPEDAHFAQPPNQKIKKAIFKIAVCD